MLNMLYSAEFHVELSIPRFCELGHAFVFYVVLWD